MKEEHDKINRGSFFKTMGAVGLTPALAAMAQENTDPNKADTKEKTQEPKFPQVPKRVLGKTGVEVPVLGLGTMYNLIENQIMLRKSLQWGANYWDTANNYAGGNSERGIGKFFSKNPDARKDVFLVTKASGAKNAKQVENRLQTSLKRMNTTYIDLYYGVHALSSPSELTDELKQWAKEAKERKVIRFFGFSTHTNMADNLLAAAKCDWIDAVMPSYNFRLMQDAKMLDAIEACHKAGIGLVAMKTTGKTIVGWARQEVETDEDKKMSEKFVKLGFTQEQANIKVVLENERIGSACVGMENTSVLAANAAAVLDKTKFSQTDRDAFKEYAAATCSGYCAGCANICVAAAPQIPINDIMRYLMYCNSYGEKDMARQLFAQIPVDVRNRLLNTDYSGAEARCPQHLPIGKLMAEAVSKLA